jgi:GNAT superfamily N-acetyltransferase
MQRKDSAMLMQYTLDTLPTDYEWQIRDFVRIHWYDAFQHDVNETLHTPFWHPRYFVIANQRALFSAATAVWKPVEINGTAYKTYGLSSVLTYPAFRGKGYGLQVVEAATDYIKQQADADMAILWTGENLLGFYGRFGWERPENLWVMHGPQNDPQLSYGEPMMLFLSERARQMRPSLIGGTFYFGEYTW